MWQTLFDSLKHQDFVVIAVAIDQPEAARPWIEAATPAYPCLIDRDHHLSDLYNMVNVPQAVWIDEHGVIVRPPETAGSTDGFRSMDRTRFTIPESVIAERNRIKTLYLDAVHDWATKGKDSVHALGARQVAQRLGKPSQNIGQAHALFRLGQLLLRQGNSDEAAKYFAQAVELHPESWSIWRQTAEKDARGLAAGPAFWERVDALGNRPYYAPINITGA